MPLGWYLAQGLVPLGPSSSDDEEGPCELPNGRLVCGPHGLVVCGRCCTDYSFMEDSEISSEEDEEDDGDEKDKDGNDDDSTSSDTFKIRAPEPNIKRGTGLVFATKFIPPTSSTLPTELFHGKSTYLNVSRYIHRDDPQAILIYTDGACLNNGQPNPKAGWAFVQGPGNGNGPSIVSGRLENEGPFGEKGVQSSNRAELRAIIAALRFRAWSTEGLMSINKVYRSMTIATDSKYVVDGSTEWAKTWVKNGWKTNGQADVKNKDLWEALLGEFERWGAVGFSIRFWRIPREWNETADAAAKMASSKPESPDKWVDILGMSF